MASQANGPTDFGRSRLVQPRFRTDNGEEAYIRGELLDGAAFAAQQLGSTDLPARLERAWRAAPDMDRLRRWLGSSKDDKTLRRHIAKALAACPEHALPQRALLLVLAGDFASAIKLLAGAPGLGWSSANHPGHLLFPLFCGLLGDAPPIESARDLLETVRGEPRLPVPTNDELLQLANVAVPLADTTRALMLEAMRKAAEARIAAVTENQRRRRYGHAASLALACARIDRSAETAEWLSAIRAKYRRYPALQRELWPGEGRR